MYRLLLVVLVSTLLLALPAAATDVNQLWGVDTGSVTKLEAFLMTSGAVFSTPGLVGPDGAVLTQPNAQYAVATASSPSSWAAGALYSVSIDSSVSSFELDILESGVGGVQENIAFFYNPGATGYTNSFEGRWYWNAPTASNLNLSQGEYDRSAVPEAATFLYFGSGLVAFWLGRRRKATA